MNPSARPGDDRRGLTEVLRVTRQHQINLRVTHNQELRYQAPPGTLTPALKAQLAAHKEALIAYLKSVPPTSPPPAATEAAPAAVMAGKPAAALSEAILTARDWEDLEGALDALPAAYEAGDVNQAQAEDLSRLAMRVSRKRPARLDGIKAGDLLPPSRPRRNAP